MSSIISVSGGKTALYSICDSNVYVGLVLKTETFLDDLKCYSGVVLCECPSNRQRQR